VVTVILVVAVLAVTAVVGYWGQQQFARRHVADDPTAHVEPLPTSELVIPVCTLAGLLLAFVLLSVYSSYQDAQSKAATEAGSVLAMARESELLTPQARDEMLGRLQCYARSVAGPDWDAQADNGRLSPITDKASDAITLTLRQATTETDNRFAISAILSDDSQRIQARIQRADEGRPSVPTEVWLLLLATVAIIIGGLSAFWAPRRAPFGTRRHSDRHDPGVRDDNPRYLRPRPTLQRPRAGRARRDDRGRRTDSCPTRRRRHHTLRRARTAHSLIQL
jgi:hypothetical protein